MTKITIITATLNASAYISSLIESLEKQTSQDFDWLVMDGGSEDGTVELVKCSTINHRLVINSDFGVYDALNKAIQIIETKYYLVVGADDRLYEDAVQKYINAVDHHYNVDLFATNWVEKNTIQKPENGSTLIHGLRSISACHSVALLINKELHKYAGYYSKEYPVCADYDFICKCLLELRCKQVKLNFVAGEYANDGYSSRQYWSYVFEIFEIKIRYYNKIMQKLILIYRLRK